MNGYRKIWEKAYGEIPTDEQGRKYEIHHIDGNRSNNKLSNLMCVSIEEHYRIHLEQGDYGAAFRIAERLNIDPATKSWLASEANKRRLEKGDHPFLDPAVREKGQKSVEEKIKRGIHALQNPEIIKRAVEAKREKYTSKDLADFAKKGWERWKEKGIDTRERTVKGSVAGAAKTKSTKWYHKLTGEQLRTTEDDPRLLEGWIKGRFNGKELSNRANLIKFIKSQQNKK